MFKKNVGFGTTVAKPKNVDENKIWKKGNKEVENIIFLSSDTNFKD